MPAAASSQTVPPARETARSAAASAAPKWSVCGDEDVVVSFHATAQRLVVALSADVQDGGPTRAPCGDGELVERLRARERAEDGDDGPVDREAEQLSALFPCRPQVRRRDGAADDAVLAPLPAFDLVGEKDPAGERNGKPVGETEVRVCLGQRGRDPPQPGSDYHRPGDVAAAAEHDGGPAPTEDAETGERRAQRPGRARGGGRRPARVACRRRRTCRARSLLQEPAATRRDPGTRRTSRSPLARAALPRRREPV